MAAARTDALRQAGATEKALNARMTAMGHRATAIGRTMTRTISIPALAVGGASVKMAFDFEESMQRIRNLVGASEKQVEHWGKALLELGPKLGKSPQELADALYFVTSSGIEASKALDVVKISAKASALGLGETEIVADAVTSALNAYGQENLSAARATETLMQAVKFGKGEPEELAASIGRVIPVAAKLEVPFNDVGASLSALTLQGLDAAEATTALRGIFTTTLKPSAEAEKMLARFGLSAESIRESLAEKGTLATLQMLSERFKGNEERVATLFPNVRALVGAFNLTGGSAERNAEIFDEMKKKTDDVRIGFQRLSKTDAFKLRKTLAGLQAEGIRIGNELLPALADLAPTIRGIASAFASMPGFARDILIGAIVLGPAIRAFGALAVAIGGIGRMLGRLGGASTRNAGAVLGGRLLAGFGGVLGPGLVAAAAGAAAALTSGGIVDTLEGHGATWGRKLADSVGQSFGPVVDEAIRRKSLPALRSLTDALNDYADQAAEVDEEAAADIRSMAEKSSRAFGRIQAKISDVRHDIKAFGNTWGLTLNEIDQRTERNMRQIEQSMGKHSRKGRIALADNFFAAADAIQNSIDTGEINSKQGLKRIEQLMMKALKAYGIKNPAVVLQETERRANAPVARAMGGGIPIPGQGSGDKVPVTVGGVPVAWTEPGEDLFVLNRTAAAKRRQLMALNAAVPRRQDGGFVDLWGRGMAHLATGGIVPVPGFPGERMNSAVLDVWQALQRRFNLFLTDAYGPGHASREHTEFGTAVDVVPGPGGSWGDVGRAVAHSVKAGYTPVYYDGSGGSTDLPPHGPGHHAHLTLLTVAELLSGKRPGSIAEALDAIRLPRFEALTQFATPSATALNNISFGLEERLNRGLAAMGGMEGPESGALMSGSGEVERVFARVAKRLSTSRTATLALGEAGYHESGMRDLSFGHSSSQGALQLLASTAAGMGISPHDEAAISSAFLTRGFWGKGGANALAAQGLPAHAVAHMVQGNATGTGVYAAERGRAQAWMRRFGLRRGGIVPGFAEGGIVGLVDRFVKDYKGTEGAGDRRKLISETAKRIKQTKQLGVEDFGADGSELGGALAALRAQADQYGQWATNAGSMGITDSEGNEVPGIFQGRSEGEWLTDQLASLFSLRNALTTALKALERVRERVREMVERVKKQLQKVKRAIKDGEKERRGLEKERRKLERDLQDASDRKEKDNKAIQRELDAEMAKDPKKRNKERIKRLREMLHSKSSEKDAIRSDLAANASQLSALADSQDRRTKLRDALSGPISDVLTARNTALVSGEQTARSELDSVQGSGFSDEFMPAKPEIGELGGEIFDVEVSLRDLGLESPELTDTEPTEADDSGFSISELLEFAEAIRFGAFDQDLNALPAFHTGGIVDGPVGTQEVLARLLPQEGIIDAGTMRDGVGPRRGKITITNWREGTGYFEEVADGRISESERQGRAVARAGVAG